MCKMNVKMINTFKFSFQDIRMMLKNGLFMKEERCIRYPCLNLIFNRSQYNFSSVSYRKPITLKRYASEKVLKEKQEKLKVTQELFHKKGNTLLKDLQRTRRDLKVKIEAIIERENIWTIPNWLCVSRVIASPYLGYLVIHKDFNTAIYLLAFAGVTDVLDGFIARNFKNQSSKLGSFLDPMADKILIGTLFLSLTYIDLMPLYLTVLIASRDIFLATAGFYIRYMSLPKPRTFSSYFDVSLATAQLSPTFISKINTLIQLTTAGVTLVSPVFGFNDHIYLYYLWWATGISTVASGMSYVFSKNTYKLLKSKKEKP